MAGHSHFSNIKHKKDRNNSSKSKAFLKLGDKIRIIIRDGSEASYKKAYSLARENNFPKDKIDSIIRKSRDFCLNSSSFYDSGLKLLKFGFNIILLLSFDDNKEKNFNLAESVFSDFGPSELENNKLSGIFNPLFSIKIESKIDFEEFLNSNLTDELFDDIKDISRLSKQIHNFEIFVSQKKSLDEIIKISYNVIESFEVKKKFFPFYPIELITDEARFYFERLGKLSKENFPSSGIFFNVA